MLELLTHGIHIEQGLTYLEDHCKLEHRVENHLFNCH